MQYVQYYININIVNHKQEDQWHRMCSYNLAVTFKIVHEYISFIELNIA